MIRNDEKTLYNSECNDEKSDQKTYRKPELVCIGSITDKTKATVSGNGVDGPLNYS